MKKRIISILLLTAMVMTMMPAAFAVEAAEATPLSVSNGGFEEDLAGSWEVSNELELINNCVHMSVTGEKRLNQTVAVVPGKTYIFLANVKTSASIGKYGADIWTSSGRVNTIPAGYPFVMTASPDWSRYTKVFEAGTAAACEIRLVARGGSDVWDLYWDDCSLYEYDPETQTTVGSDLLVNGSFDDGMSGDGPAGWNAFWFGDCAVVADVESYVHMTVNSEKRLNQTVAVEPGKTYIFSANARTSASIGEYGADIWVVNGGRVNAIPNGNPHTDGYPFTNKVSAEGYTYTKVFEAGTAASVEIQLKARGGSAVWDLYWDDCTLYEYNTETQTTVGSNLLVNGSFDNGTTGWNPFWFTDCSVVTEDLSGGGVYYYRDNHTGD